MPMLEIPKRSLSNLSCPLMHQYPSYVIRAFNEIFLLWRFCF